MRAALVLSLIASASHAKVTGVNSVRSHGHKEKIVIAHRGASGYLPEHTLEAKAMAAALGADYLEQDLVMTSDHELIVMHDIWLDTTTDVATKFPGRNWTGGRYFAINFTLAEIKTLHVTERFKVVDGKRAAVFGDRFPLFKSYFRVPSFEEELQLIQGMEKSTGWKLGIYPEIKDPWFHRAAGMDITQQALMTLRKYNYTRKTDRCFLQCFDANELEKRVPKLSADLGMSLKTIQLMPPNGRVKSNGAWVKADFSWFQQAGAMGRVAKYADGIGPYHGLLVNVSASQPGNIVKTGLAADAHRNGLQIHPFTFRREASQLPSYAPDLRSFISLFYFSVPVDGLFTDFPDVAVAVLNHATEAQRPSLATVSIISTIFSLVR